MGLERKAAVALALLLAGCAVPQYQLQLVEISPSHAAMREQAYAICEPQAQLAGIQAEEAVRARNDARNNQVTGARCDTIDSGYYATTDCRATRPAASPALGLVQGMNVAQAGNNARDATLRGCLAQYGWRPVQRCVANCG